MSFDLRIKNRDLVIDKGDLVSVSNSDKLVQDILKILITSVGGNVLQPWYGSGLSSTLVGSSISSDILFTAAKTQIQNCLETLKSLQNLQISEGRKVSPEEQIAAITKVSIIKDPSDPRIIRVSVQVLSKAFTKVNVDFNVNNI